MPVFDFLNTNQGAVMTFLTAVMAFLTLSGLKRRKKEMNDDGPRSPRALPWALPCEPFRLGLVSGHSTIFLTGRRAKGFNPFSPKG